MNNSNAHANTAPVKKIRGLKRKLIQIAAFGFTNAHIPNFLSGKLYTGKWKEFCAPGLNCYSCPAAAFACPIGALQAVTGSRKSPISFYVFGLLLAFGVIFGRAVCGFLCPFGLLQELLAKVPLPKKKLPAFMRYIKYLILIVFVLIRRNSGSPYAAVDPFYARTALFLENRHPHRGHLPLYVRAQVLL